MRDQPLTGLLTDSDGLTTCLSLVDLESIVVLSIEFDVYGLQNIPMSRLGRLTLALNRGS